ncbi:MAG TPA: IS481 family transposase, partial [Geminicoccaceae bacterium]
EHGVETPDGHVRAPAGLLRRATVDRHLRRWGYDQERMGRPPATVRFEAERSNALWQLDLSPSDLKQIKAPPWLEPGRGAPTLMLYSVVDDRSGVCYQEYRCVYGEDVEAALRFLFNAMAPKPEEGFAFQGIPEALYLDNGPIAKSRVFNAVMDRLGVRVMTHLPAGKDGRRPTARSKGKVERAFRSVKEAHETLYHFHRPETEAEANLWLRRYLLHYNAQPHRSAGRSRSEDWLARLPEGGFRAMCAWERFCVFAREPERRKVGGDARITVEGVVYEVDPELAGETVVLWWGLFDQDLFVEHGERRFGPYRPSGGPIPLHRYRKPRTTARDERADRVAVLAANLAVPRAALTGHPELEAVADARPAPVPSRPFADPDPFREFVYPSALEAKRAIADLLGVPLGQLAAEERAAIDAILHETLERGLVLTRVRAYFATPRSKDGGRC